MAEELEQQIEAAEEASDAPKLLELISTCTSHGGDDDWTEVAEGSLDALFRIAKGGSTSVADEAISALFDSLKAWKEEEAIVEVALGCIVALSKFYKAADNDKLDLTLLLSILRDFPDESTIQEQACLAVEGLAWVSDSAKESLKAMDGMQEELVAARGRISNERNKAYPGRAAQALGLTIWLWTNMA